MLSKRDLPAWMSGMLYGLGEDFMEACERMDLPLGAVHRLTSPRGRHTWDAIARLALQDWYEERALYSKHSLRGVDRQPLPKSVDRHIRGIITVPDLAAIDLTELTNDDLTLTYLGPEYEGWNYYRRHDGTEISGRGKRFEFMMSEPGLETSSKEARKCFRNLGFCGHTGAFTQWCRVYKLDGNYASIPEDDDCLRKSDGRLYVPSARFDDDSSLRCTCIDEPWEDYLRVVFVGFRELAP